MNAASGVDTKPVVFISYAHESPELVTSVEHLAGFLAQHFQVLSDHEFGDRAPPEGWIVWMSRCVRDADVVLIICTPSLKARYEKDEAAGVGRGATLEGAFVTQQLYDANMLNTKFFPILPDEGDESDIPSFLKPWFSGHRFPRDNSRIVRLVADDQPPTTPDAMRSGDNFQLGPGIQPQSIPPSRVPVENHHEAAASELLGRPGVAPFARRLGEQLRSILNVQDGAGEALTKPNEIVAWIAACSSTSVIDVFIAIEQALGGANRVLEQDVADAAVAVLLLAASRAVEADELQRLRGLSEFGCVTFVPKTEPAVYGMLRIAILGERQLLKSLDRDAPEPNNLYGLTRPPDSVNSVEELERAILLLLNPRFPTAVNTAQDQGELSKAQAAAITILARRQRVGEKCSLLFVDEGGWRIKDLNTVAERFGVRIFVPDEAQTAKLLGIAPDLLHQGLLQFWAVLREKLGGSRAVVSSPRRSLHGGDGGSTTDQSSATVRLGNFTMGAGSTLNLVSGSDVAIVTGSPEQYLELVRLFVDVIADIRNSPTTNQREEGDKANLAEIAHSALTEVQKSDRADVGFIKQSVDRIKTFAEGLGSANNIIDFCNNAYQIIRLLSPQNGPTP